MVLNTPWEAWTSWSFCLSYVGSLGFDSEMNNGEVSTAVLIVPFERRPEFAGFFFADPSCSYRFCSLPTKKLDG